MASNPLRVSQLIDSPTRLTWQESVALVRAVAAVRRESPAAVPSGTFQEFALQENGEVTAVGIAPPLSVSELALLLARLLPATTHAGGGQTAASVANRPPAGLYFTIARALALVEAPSFAGVQDFSAALGRYEQAKTAAVLRQVFRRHTPATATVVEAEESGATTAILTRVASTAENRTSTQPATDSRNASAVVPERRRPRMPSDVLRRMLREEDRRNFLELQSRGGAARAAGTPRQTGPDAQTLRRFIREADERTYALMREKAYPGEAASSVRRPRRAGYHAAFALLVLVVAVAVLALAGWQRRVPAVDGRTSTQAIAENPMGGAAALAPVSTAGTTGSTIGPTATNPVPADPVAATMDSAKPAGQVSTARASSPSRKAATRKAAVEASVQGSRAVPKRRGPVPRLFAAIFHRLGSLVRRDSQATTQ